MGWIERWGERRAAEQAALRAEAAALLAEGRMAALLALDARAAALAGDGKALRRLNRLRLVVNDLAPRPRKPDTATRMLYR